MPPNYTHSRVVVFHTGAEARGEIGSIPIIISCYLTLSASFTRLVPYYTSTLRYSDSISAPASIHVSIYIIFSLPHPRSRYRPP